MRRVVAVIVSHLTTLSAMVTNATAQNVEAGSSHTITAGTGTQLLQDDGLSSSSERLTSLELSWAFLNSNAYRKKSIGVSVEGSVGNTGKDQLRSTEFTLQYRNAFSVLKNKTSGWNNYIGYSISVNPQYLKTENEYSWATVNSLSLYNSLVYTWKKSAVSFDLSVPLAGLASRPGVNTAYKGSVNDMLYNSFSNMDFTSLHNLKAINLSLQYQKIITGRLHFTAGASYSYKDLSVEAGFLQEAYKVHTGLSYLVK
jgi:hypothetical protein